MEEKWTTTVSFIASTVEKSCEIHINPIQNRNIYNIMDKKQVYCRYCGKLIDEDAPFCTYCGKEQGINTKPSSIWNTLYCLFQNIYSKISTIKFKSNGTAGSYIKKWLKRIIVLVVVLIVIWLIVLLCFWLYGSHLASEWTKEDERREAVALKDITKAASIARELFKESAEDVHLYNQLCWKKCGFNHIERGIAILRNAAEKGNANAQFTLGVIYAGGHYDAKEPYFMDANDELSYTMLGGKIDLKRAAYWYTLAAQQGHNTALNNLGQAYREGAGVEQDLVKATELIRKAAEQGNPYAQLSYGDMFRDGEVCIRIVTDSIKGDAFIINAKPNIRLAKEWWTKALKNGNENARERLEQVYE